MKRIERKLAEDIVYLIKIKEELRIVNKKYNDYKKWTIKMKEKGIPPSELLKGLLNKIYREYKNENMER